MNVGRGTQWWRATCPNPAPIDDLIQGAAIGLQESFRASAGSIAPVRLHCAGWMLSTSIEVSGAPATPDRNTSRRVAILSASYRTEKPANSRM